MDYRALGRTGVKVSRLCLGTMTFGEQNSEAEGHAQMDYAFDRGINIFDAAEIYPIPPKPETQGRTEAIIGTWLAARKARDKVVIATKVAGRGKMVWLRKNETATRQSPGQIMEAVEASLKRLKTDHIDLYQLHWPDRPMRIFEGLDYLHLEGDGHPIDDILGALGKLVADGKVQIRRSFERDALGGDELSQGRRAASGCPGRPRSRTPITSSTDPSRSGSRKSPTAKR